MAKYSFILRVSVGAPPFEYTTFCHNDRHALDDAKAYVKLFVGVSWCSGIDVWRLAGNDYSNAVRIATVRLERDPVVKTDVYEEMYRD